MKNILLCTFLLCCSACLFAQDKASANDLSTLEGKAKRMTNYLHKQLELNKEQVDKMYQIQLQAQRQYLEIQPIKKTDKEHYALKEQSLLIDTDSRIEMILNENQTIVYKEMVRKKAAEERVRERREKYPQKTEK